MEETVFLNLFRTYSLPLYRYALTLTCSPADAEDLAQEVWLKVCGSSLREELAAWKWLRTICYREFVQTLRRRHVAEEPLDALELELEAAALESEMAAPEEEVIVAEEIAAMQNGCFLAMVRHLTLQQRIAFSLSDMFGLPITDVAEMLEISIGAAKGLLFRARLNLDAFFSGHCGLLDAKNPCSCKAWQNFSGNREELRRRANESLGTLSAKDAGYRFDAETRGKIRYLYAHMPEQRPSESWFEDVLSAIREKKFA
jgi:RNA polymerase sigma factor (sigma-70 family)